MNRGVADVFGANPYLDPYQMRLLNKEYAFSTQKRFCEAPITLREVLKLKSAFYAVIEVYNTVTIYVVTVFNEYTRVITPVYSEHKYDSKLIYSMTTILLKDDEILSDKRLVFTRFDLGTVRQVLLNRGCGTKLANELILLDLESVKSETDPIVGQSSAKSTELLHKYLYYSLLVLNRNMGYKENGDYHDPESVIVSRLSKE